ncbi:MAG: hypothetical protein ABI338_01005 [Gemmatimonadaceae bacterium]
MNRCSFSRAGAAAAAVVLALVATGCTEKLDSSAGCPITCVDQSVQIQTVTLDAVQVDSTVPGGLGKGTEQQMLLANRGDTLDTRVIIRFDSLPATSQTSQSANAVPIAYVDSVMLKLVADSGALSVGVPVTLSLYDVDDSTMVDDTSATALTPLFTPARLITSVVFPARTLVDSIRIPLPSAFVLAKAQARARLRLGLQVSASTSVHLKISAQGSGASPVLYMRVSPDTVVAPIALTPRSVTPRNNASIASSLGDFTLIVKGTPPPPPGMLGVGGLPGTRAYLLFNVPPAITDSSLVVAATLVLTQQANQSPDATDSMSIQPHLVLAGPGVIDPTKAAQVVASLTVLGLAPLLTPPASAGVREFQIGPVFKYWAIQTASLLPRAIVLESAQEDFSAQQALFYSSSAAPDLRPKLRISYTPRSKVGLP